MTLLGGWQSLQAQIINDPLTGIPEDPLEQELERDTVIMRPPEKDTFPIFLFQANAPYQEKVFDDTLLNNFFYQYDPVRRRDWDYQHLGVPGTAHHPIVFESAERMGFNIGQKQYGLYTLRSEEMPFYRLDKPFTQVGYILGGQQVNDILEAQFSRNFSQGVNLSFDYQRISQTGDQNLFPHQLSRTRYIGIGLRFRNRSGRYQAFLALSSNRLEFNENGGVVEEPVLGEDFETPSSAEVFSETAERRTNGADYRYTHYFNLRRPDSLGRDSLGYQSSRQRYQLRHSIAYGNERHKYFDDFGSVSALAGRLDSILYGDLLTDQRGLRLFVEQRRLENQFDFLTYRPEALREDQARGSRGLIRVGLKHQIHWLDFESQDSVINNLFLTGSWDVVPAAGIRLETYAHLGLLDQAGDYRIQGDLRMKWGPAVEFHARAVNQLYSPDLFQDRLIVSQVEVWNNDFQKTLETTLSAGLRIPKFRTEVTAVYHLINNYIYFNQSRFPIQTGTPISIGQLLVRQDFTFGALHLDNWLALQTASEDFVRVPTVFGKHSLYVIFPLFKVLNTRVGADFRYQSSYDADYYHPLVGQFILQDQQEVDLYPSLDLMAAIRVTKFRFFFKWERFTELFLPTELYYQTAGYPFPPGSNIRFGFRWRFSN